MRGFARSFSTAAALIGIYLRYATVRPAPVNYPRRDAVEVGSAICLSLPSSVSLVAQCIRPSPPITDNVGIKLAAGIQRLVQRRTWRCLVLPQETWVGICRDRPCSVCRVRSTTLSPGTPLNKRNQSLFQEPWQSENADPLWRPSGCIHHIPEPSC